MAFSAQNALTRAIPGLWRQKISADKPKFLSAAPFNFSNGLGQYQIMATDSRYDARNPAQGLPMAANSQFVLGNQQLSTVSVETARYGSELLTVSTRDLEAIQDANAAMDVAGLYTDSVASQLYGKFNSLAVSAISGLTSAGTLATGTLSTDLNAYVNSAITTIQKASGKRPNTVFISRDTFLALQNLDTIQSGTAISVAASAGARARTGWADESNVAAFFASKGLTLIVDDSTYINSSGTEAFDFTGTGVICYVGNAFNSALTTFCADRDVARFYFEETKLPMQPGLAIAADMQVKVEATNPSAALKLVVTY